MGTDNGAYFCGVSKNKRAQNFQRQMYRASTENARRADAHILTPNKINKKQRKKKNKKRIHGARQLMCGVRLVLVLLLLLLIKKRNPRSRSQLIFTVRTRAHTYAAKRFIWHFRVRSILFSLLRRLSSCVLFFFFFGSCEILHGPTEKIKYIKIHSFAYTRAY